MYLKGRVPERQQGMVKELYFSLQLHPCDDHNRWSWAGLSLGVRSPCMGAGAQDLAHPIILCQAHQQEAGSEVGQPGLNLVPMWDAVAASGDFIYFATPLAT